MSPFILISIGQSLLPLLGVLASSKSSNCRYLADLVIDLIHIGVTLKLFHGPNEWYFAHHDNFLEQKVDQRLLQAAIIVVHLRFYKSYRLYLIDGLFATLLNRKSMGLKQNFRAYFFK